MKNNFYITTTLPYVNADPHIGFALEIIAADVLARFHRLMGDEVIFNTGTDEHGQKIYQKAKEQGKDPQSYCDEYAAKFKELKSLLSLSYTDFIRTTDPHHLKAAQEFWKRCKENGYISKKLYKIKYCVGCELEKTESELVDGRCPLHPRLELEIREEENYFFKFSAFQKPLLEFYAKTPHFVEPEGKFNEIRAFVQQGLQDFSISRLKAKMPWGIPVPDDADHIMYVWFDALVNYISILGWPESETKYSQFWPGIQIAGKDNLRQQAAMWQAMLLAAKLPPSAKILINGFISIDGQKMSKSLGNVISPQEMVKRYSVDGARFLLLALGPIDEDMDVTIEKFDQTYSADLANGLGNLISRVTALCEKDKAQFPLLEHHLSDTIVENLNQFNLRSPLEFIVSEAKRLDKEISELEPWKLESEALHEFLVPVVEKIRQLAMDLEPFLPDLAHKLQEHFSQEKIGKISPLFPRLEKS